MMNLKQLKEYLAENKVVFELQEHEEPLTRARTRQNISTRSWLPPFM